jgi:PAS domain S-box-containing protein/putative nucleotidyltransferase with HDIG domain
MDDVVYTLDTQQRHTGVYGNWIERSNLTEEFFLGKTSSEIFGSEVGMVHEVPTRKALTGENVAYEWDLFNDNKRTYYHTSLSPMYDPEGNISGVVGIGRDITSIKKAEIELMNSKNRFIKAQEMGRFGHWSYNIETRKFTGSKVTFEIYGFDELETVSFEDVVSCISKSDVERFTVKFNKLILEGWHFDEQFEIFPCGSNLPCYVRNIANVLLDENGILIIEGVVQDITELKKLELQVINTAKQNQRILDNLQDAYFQADLSGKCTIVNPKAVSMYGYQFDKEMIGQPVQILYANSEDRNQLIEMLKESGALADYSCRGRKKNGTIFNVSMNVQFVKDDSGNIIGTEGLVRDITDRMRLEEELENEKNNLEISNQKLSERLNQSVMAISKIGEMRDVYTAGHQKRVQQLACEIALHMGLSDEAIMNISYGALIHDIGKIYIASDILNKPGKISNLEYQILQTHAENSYEIVKEIDFPKEISTMIYQHHERIDGSGYPHGLSGDAIIIESRILAVADVVEAMTSHRPYRAALGIDAAIDEIQRLRGTKYDADVVDICVNLFNNGYTLV